MVNLNTLIINDARHRDVYYDIGGSHGRTAASTDLQFSAHTPGSRTPDNFRKTATLALAPAGLHPVCCA